MPTENSVITREHLPGLLLARTIWENGGPSLYFPPALQDATDQARAALPAPASVPDGYMPIPTAEQLADALESVRCFHDMSAELIAPELLANLLAATTVKAEPAQCTNEDSWNCKYCRKTETCEALADKRNFGTPATSLPAAGSVELEEAASILRNMIDSIGVHGNYSQESTLLFLNQALSSIVAALSAQQSAHVSVPGEWLDAVKELFDAKQAKEDFERENPGNSTKRWDACLYRIEAAEDALRALLNGGEA